MQKVLGKFLLFRFRQNNFAFDEPVGGPFERILTRGKIENIGVVEIAAFRLLF